MADDYDIVAVIKRIEDELIASMIRNLDRHRAEENDLGINWEQWQVKQLAALDAYKKRNAKKYNNIFKDINDRIGPLISMQRAAGNASQEIAILKAIKEGAKLTKPAGGVGDFFRMNDRKMNALIKATTDDFQKAEYAMLRMSNDKYRQIIFNAQMYANSGAATYETAVDMATKDFLRAGINCIEYKNGARHTVSDYVDMAIRTAGKRAYLAGEGEKRKEWGISTVIMNKRGNPCPKCLPFVGKVLIDDVWSGGSSKDGAWPLMSSAIAAGLYHPRCKDGHSTYFPDISAPPDDKFTRKEIEDVEEKNRKEAKQQYAERQAESYNRLATYSLDSENRRIYKARAGAWEAYGEQRYTVTKNIKEHRADTPQTMVDLVDKYTKDEFIIVDDTAEHAFVYDSDKDAVIISTEHPQYPHYDYQEVMIHEIAHRIDQNEYGSPMNMQYVEAIIRTQQKILNNANMYRKLFEQGGEFEYNSIISDMLGCITNNEVVGISHHDSQYIGTPGYRELEVFADMFSALYQGDDATVSFIKKELGEVYQAFLNILGA